MCKCGRVQASTLFWDDSKGGKERKAGLGLAGRVQEVCLLNTHELWSPHAYMLSLFTFSSAQVDKSDASAKVKFTNGKTAWFPIAAMSEIEGADNSGRQSADSAAKQKKQLQRRRAKAAAARAKRR